MKGLCAGCGIRIKGNDTGLCRACTAKLMRQKLSYQREKRVNEEGAMPSPAALAKIHIAKKELGLTDETYRDMLYLHFQVESAKELDDRQATVLLNTFRLKGWKPKKQTSPPRQKRRDGRFIEIKPGPAAAQQRKVLALWNALGYGMDKLHSRCQRQFGVDRFEWLTDGRHLHVLITDLDQRLRQANKGKPR